MTAVVHSSCQVTTVVTTVTATAEGQRDTVITSGRAPGATTVTGTILQLVIRIPIVELELGTVTTSYRDTRCKNSNGLVGLGAVA